MPGGVRRRRASAGRARSARARGARRSSRASTACSRSTGGTATASVLVDAELSGLLDRHDAGDARAEDIYRALIEATAYGTRVIIETFEANGVPVPRSSPRAACRRTRCSCRSTPTSPAARQPHRLRPEPGARLGDVRGRRRRRATRTIADAAAPAMARLQATTSTRRIRPPPTSTTCCTPSTSRLHDYFGRGENDVMKTLRGLRGAAKDGGPMQLERSATSSATCTAAAPQYGLVVWTGGNVSARDPASGLCAIKPSGVRYEDLTAETMVVVRPRRERRRGRASSRRRTRPATCTSTATCPDVNGVVHTHSRYATALAAARRADPVLLTAQADEFGGEIPCGGFALIGDDAIGRPSSRATGHARRRSC